MLVKHNKLKLDSTRWSSYLRHTTQTRHSVVTACLFLYCALYFHFSINRLLYNIYKYDKISRTCSVSLPEFSLLHHP